MVTGKKNLATYAHHLHPIQTGTHIKYFAEAGGFEPALLRSLLEARCELDRGSFGLRLHDVRDIESRERLRNDIVEHTFRG